MIDPRIQILPQVSEKDQAASLRSLVEIYNQISIFVNMPAYSQLLVTKVTEVMACRTMLITPSMDHASAIPNMAPFEHGKHLVYYNPGRPEGLGLILDYYISHPEERAAIAQAGWDEVNSNHTLNARLGKIMADAERVAATHKD